MTQSRMNVKHVVNSVLEEEDFAGPLRGSSSPF